MRRDGRKGKWKKREMGKDLNCKNHRQRQYPIFKRTKSNKSSLRCFTYIKSKHKRARDDERLSRCETNLDMGITEKPQTDRQTDKQNSQILSRKCQGKGRARRKSQPTNCATKRRRSANFRLESCCCCDNSTSKNTTPLEKTKTITLQIPRKPKNKKKQKQETNKEKGKTKPNPKKQKENSATSKRTI